MIQQKNKILVISLSFILLGCDHSLTERKSLKDINQQEIVLDTLNSTDKQLDDARSSHDLKQIKLKNKEYEKKIRNKLGIKYFLTWEAKVKSKCSVNSHSLGDNIGLEYEICYEKFALKELGYNNNTVQKNSDDVIVSELPFDSRLYLNCATKREKNCNNLIHILTMSEMKNYTNIINNSYENTAILPTSKNGVLILISTYSEQDNKMNYKISISIVNSFGIKKDLEVKNSQYFIIDSEYIMSIYNSKNHHMERKINLAYFSD